MVSFAELVARLGISQCPNSVVNIGINKVVSSAAYTK